MPRYFIALNLPENIKAEFKRIQVILKQQNQDVKINWVDPQISHINLHFLGNLNTDDINQLKQGLNTLKGKYGSILLNLTGVGGFPDKQKPHVLFLGVSHRQKNNLIKLYQDLSQILNTQKIKTQNQPFIAHVTLGRVLQQKTPLNIPGEEMPDIPFAVNSFELMQSELTAKGPIYKIIHSYSLC